MSAKNYTDVIIAGKVYTIAGSEDVEYIQKVAAFLNGKFDELRRLDTYRRQTPEDQALLMELNIADDYFKEKDRADRLEAIKNAHEKEIYELKHALITAQMKKDVQEKKQRRTAAAEEKETAAPTGTKEISAASEVKETTGRKSQKKDK